MFIVGTHLHTGFLTQAFRSAMSISAAGTLVPFALGAALALALYGDGRFFAAGVSPLQAMVYFGAAMSVTAFPVLARIIHERGIAGTYLGTLALAAGAASDVVAWCLLAIVLASLSNDPLIGVSALVGGVAYVAAAHYVVRPQFSRVAAAAEREGSLGPGALGLILIVLFTGAWFTDLIGVHAVFGAFVLGIAVPRGFLTKELTRQIEPFATTFLVPLFFAYSGFSTNIRLIATWDLLVTTVVVVAAATIGKGVACWAGAVWAGRPNREALAIGALMNARGLMELIILNIGLERGLITPTLFAVMVTMTLATTVAAGPLFDRAWRGSAEVPDAAGLPVR
jgi:Kef-type K+ transport system membrane component KefB